MLGDAEFLVILRDGAKLISDPEFGRVGRQMTRELKELGVVCHLDLSAAQVDYFQKMRPHIFAYELRSCGRTLWGDAKIIESIPAFAAGEIPREDAWRLLCNRIIEQLRIVRRLYSDEQDSWKQTVYVCNKFLLDLGTSLLVFLDQYEPTYQLRAEKIEQLARNGAAARLPFSPAEFSRRVRELTAIKLRPELDPSLGELDLSPQAQRDAALSRWLEAVPYARALWEWEVALLAGAEPGGVQRGGPVAQAASSPAGGREAPRMAVSFLQPGVSFHGPVSCRDGRATCRRLRLVISLTWRPAGCIFPCRGFSTATTAPARRSLLRSETCCRWCGVRTGGIVSGAICAKRWSGFTSSS